MKLRFTRRAIQDLAEITDYLRSRNPAAVQRVRASILDGLKRITTFPKIGRPQAEEGVRKLVTRRYRYLIYYTAETSSEEIIVLAIRHPARDREFGDA